MNPFSLMTLKDSNVLIGPSVASPHFTLKTKSIIHPMRTLSHDQSAFAILWCLDAVASWFPGLWLSPPRNSRRPAESCPSFIFHNFWAIILFFKTILIHFQCVEGHNFTLKEVTF